MLLDSEFSSFFQFLQWGDKLSEPESLDGQQPEPVAEPEPIPEPVAKPESGDEPQIDLDSETFEEKEERKAQEDNDLELVADDRTQEPTDVGSHTESTSPESSHLFAVKTTGGQEKIVMRLLEARIKLDHNDEEYIEKAKEELPFYDSAKLYKENDQIKINQTSLPKEEAILNMNITEKILSRFYFFKATPPKEKADVDGSCKVCGEEWRKGNEIFYQKGDNGGKAIVCANEPCYTEQGGKPMSFSSEPPKMAPDGKHLASDKFWEENFTAYPRTKNIHSVVLLSDFKGYVVIEAEDPSAMFAAIQNIRHVRGQLRGELTYDDIDKYLIKKSTVSELAVENTVEIIGGPFKGMKATITRLDQEKEEAVVVLLDATYQLPVTVDANYLKLVPTQ